MNWLMLRRVVLAGVISAIAAGLIPAYHYYQSIETHVSTDDAEADATVALVSSRVAGTITNVFVEDNWTVNEGSLLLTLDSRDFDVRVDQAEAQLDRAKQSVDELYSQVGAAKSGVELAGSQLRQARIDFARAKSLKNQGVRSEERRVGKECRSRWSPYH